MIKKFKHNGLKELFECGNTAKIEKRMHKRILLRLDALDAATKPEDMNLPGFNFHSLTGKKPKQFTIHVNGPWCIVFEFSDGDVLAVDFINYD